MTDPVSTATRPVNIRLSPSDLAAVARLQAAHRAATGADLTVSAMIRAVIVRADQQLGKAKP